MVSRPAELSDTFLRELAGATVFARGQAYFDEQRVTVRKASASEVAADVTGSDEYRTRLRFEDDELHSTCTCPHAEEGAFCKHMVAASLAWRGLPGGERESEPRKDAAPAADTTPPRSAAGSRREVLLRFLVDQDKGWLADQLLQAATGDPVLEKRLLLAARTHQAEQDPKALERAPSEAIASPGMLDSRGSNRFARRLDAPIDHLAQLLDAGRVEAALGGCLYLLKRLLAIYQRGDVDGLVALMLGGADVSACDHLRAAEALEQAGRPRDATTLLERAVRHFDDDRLPHKLEQIYRRDGCDTDADAILWRLFEQRPRRETFEQLLAAAGQRWPEWRSRAYAVIAKGEAASLQQARRWQRDAVADPGLRIACLIVEGRIEGAAALAESQPLPLRTLDAALRQFARTRPQTAFALLRRWLPDALRNANVSQYQRVGEVLLDIGRHQPARRFAAFPAGLRAEQARRPRLIEILDGVVYQLGHGSGTQAKAGSRGP